jgi:nuclear pore complex protein Nup98-Nup96
MVCCCLLLIVVHYAGEVAVYVTGEGAEPNKPPVGSGLNCTCRVTLTGVVRKAKQQQNAAAAAAAFRKRLARYCSEMGARFVDYKPEGGAWIFEVSGDVLYCQCLNITCITV